MTISGTVRRLGRGRKWLALLGFGAAVTVAAAVGGLAARNAEQRYAGLEQPAWAPPAWLFGPVWTVLYALIAAAGWLVWRRVGWGPALWAWVVQLALNALWTPLFFAAGRYGLALAELVLMWLAIGVTVDRFRRISAPAAGLLLPYWAWVTFAGALNLAICRLNP
ncbi:MULTISPECIES: TspO/MBR family protein [Micromonospora]|uniref:Tryptophan-rich sensory protein n=1 Tax=Micromonospora solifontis TaxID=2487138 RepID=A0ABX9WDM4_9ACTN|nr:MULTISPECIES: TspO/MBR family protein [Micromonospora]NES16785.1 tryptophan-rich sensory protein [Micromonospora sp. PPF5-17B]NES37803.1 tryptophan-rich sensory protein [Micromonospora solifontis]RNL97903.1 tryptophan-rich sensory protein [Micromonospora solifontis]